MWHPQRLEVVERPELWEDGGLLGGGVVEAVEALVDVAADGGEATAIRVSLPHVLLQEVERKERHGLGKQRRQQQQRQRARGDGSREIGDLRRPGGLGACRTEIGTVTYTQYVT